MNDNLYEDGQTSPDYDSVAKEYGPNSGFHAESRPQGSSGIKGIIKNPYVFSTAIFASIGGILFGCK
jgi:hypothetical protein